MRLNGLADRLRDGLAAVFESQRVGARVVNVGSVFSIYFTDEELINYRGLARADKARAHRLFLALIGRGYYLSPPLVMNALSLPMESTHVDGLVAAVGKALKRITT